MTVFFSKIEKGGSQISTSPKTRFKTISKSGHTQRLKDDNQPDEKMEE